METNPAQQLEEIKRLKAATVSETRKLPRGALAVMPLALVGWFAGFARFQPDDGAAIVWIAVWWVFFVGWRLWVARATRARNPTELEPGTTWKSVLEWTAFFAVSQVVVWFGSKVSWILVGILLALLFTAQTFRGRAKWTAWRSAKS